MTTITAVLFSLMRRVRACLTRSPVRICKAAVATATTYSKTGRAITPAPAPPSPGGRRRYVIDVSSDALDLQGDRVLRNAVDTASAQTVPLLVSHDHSGLPIGMVGQFSYTPTGKLRATASLPPGGVSAKADELAGLIEAGVPVQFSIGFDALASTPNREGGRDFSKISLREISAVPIGAAVGTGVLGAVKMALRGKGAMVDDGQDPTRDPVAMRTCPHRGRGCPKRTGEPCTMAGGCPLHLGGSDTGGGKHASVWAKQNIPPADAQMGHHGGSERERCDWAHNHGMLHAQARQRDGEQRRRWDVLKSRLLAIDPRERPVLRAGIDISRTDLEAMPADLRAIVCGHLDLDSDPNDA